MSDRTQDSATEAGSQGLRGDATVVAATHTARLSLSGNEALVAGIACAVFAAIVSGAMGRDLNWDFLHYHAYAALTALDGRAQDFFAAGYQGYLNPVAYLPLALMLDAGWHSLLVSSVLAAIHSLNVLFTYLICRELCVDADRPRVVAIVVTATAIASGAFLGLVGSSFVDLTTTPPVLAALWILMRKPAASTAFAACVLAGVAVALKLTNVVFAIGVWASCIALALSRPWSTPRLVLVCSLAAAAGFAAVYGAWGWRLFQEFGSPVFPLFNDIFKAPDFPAQSTSFHRFVPQSLWQAMSLPFRAVHHESWIYSEVMAPDLRPAIASLLAAMLAGRWLTVRRRDGTPITSTTRSTSERVVLVFFVASLVPWIMTSGNARYAAPLVLFLGPVVFILARRLAGGRPAATLTLLIACVQGFLVLSAGNPRWAPADWTKEWLVGSVPEALRAEPTLFVNVGRSSESYLASHVHPDSVFVNPIGLVSIATDGPGWARFTALTKAYEGRTRVNVRHFSAVTDAASRHPSSADFEALSATLDRLGLQVDPAGCHVLTFDPTDEPAIRYLWDRGGAGVHSPRLVLSCPASRVGTLSPELAQQRQVASMVMNALEARCPAVFSPAGVQVESERRWWTRYYGKFDLYVRLEFMTGDIIYRMERQGTSTRIGNLRSWQEDVATLPCSLPFNGARDIGTVNFDAPG